MSGCSAGCEETGGSSKADSRNNAWHRIGISAIEMPRRMPRGIYVPHGCRRTIEYVSAQKVTGHGTVAGYKAGCRGWECLNFHTDLMTCTEADTRHHHDYAYIKAVADGTATADKETFAKPKTRIVRESAASAKRRATRIATVKSHAANKIMGKSGPISAPAFHGTKRMADRGCVDNCPNEGLEGGTCREARSRYEKERYAARKAAGTLSNRSVPKNPRWVHGTVVGADRGCTDCPQSPSCREVRRAYQNQRNAERKAA